MPYCSGELLGGCLHSQTKSRRGGFRGGLGTGFGQTRIGWQRFRPHLDGQMFPAADDVQHQQMRPGGCWAMESLISRAVSTFLPSTETMTSPGRKSDFDAGPPGIISVTTTPSPVSGERGLASV